MDSLRLILLLILGVPCGALMGLIGKKLSRKVRRPFFRGLVSSAPLIIFIWLVVLIDMLL